VSLTAGTIFHKTRTPLRVWFRIIAQMTGSKAGCSAVTISRQYGLRYETAWLILHKIRSALWQLGRDPLVREVEIDETYVGGHDQPHQRGRSLKGKKVLVVAAVEKDEGGMGRVRMAQVTDAKSKHLMPFVRENVRPRSTVHTDGHRGYNPLRESGYAHLPVFLFGEELAKRALPCVHRVFSLLKRVLLSTHQGAVSRKHLQRYLDEFVFRFNRRRARPWLAFQRVLERYVQRAPTYDDLVAPDLLQLVGT
jgi:transposase-like protein